MSVTIPAAEALSLHALIVPTPQGIASRLLAKATGGGATLFAFDAFVLVLEGSLVLTVAGARVNATPGTIVRLPANVSHALEAEEPARML